jgi:ParB-like chromosome segregation protein Spo0J
VYELIAGHRRVQATKEIGWSDIEGNVVNVSDSEALFLALKTNLMREDMNERDQGLVLHEITQKFNLSNVNLAKKIGMSEKWVRSRIRLAMDLSDKVINALETNQITYSVAEILGSLEPRLQDDFLIYISTNNIGRNEADVRRAKKRFLNNTIYTIGIEGRKITDFIGILKENGIGFCKVFGRFG